MESPGQETRRCPARSRRRPVETPVLDHVGRIGGCSASAAAGLPCDMKAACGQNAARARMPHGRRVHKDGSAREVVAFSTLKFFAFGAFVTPLFPLRSGPEAGGGRFRAGAGLSPRVAAGWREVASPCKLWFEALGGEAESRIGAACPVRARRCGGGRPPTRLPISLNRAAVQGCMQAGRPLAPAAWGGEWGD